MERRASKDGKEAGIKRGTSSSSSSSISSRRKSKTPDNVPKLEESYEKEGVKFWVECFGPGRLVPWTTFVNNIDVSPTTLLSFVLAAVSLLYNTGLPMP